MERLTFFESGRWWIKLNGGMYGGFPEVDRLAAYEDAMPIERAQELAQAEKDGRLVVLPCKVTDTVYITETVFDNGKQKRLNKSSGERVVSAQIDHVTIGGTTGMPVFDLCTETGGWYYSMEANQFYLTREEAEAALKKREET